MVASQFLAALFRADDEHEEIETCQKPSNMLKEQ